MANFENVIEADLNSIANSLKDEFSEMMGSNLLLIGGAGSLGFYLVKSILFWNKTQKKEQD